VTVGGEARLARTPFWACGHWSACARYGRLINRPCLATPSEAVSAQADTWREAPEEGDFNRLNSYQKGNCSACSCEADYIRASFGWAGHRPGSEANSRPVPAGLWSGGHRWV